MRDTPCPKCPCPGICLRWAPFCAWAGADPPDEVSLRHICARSGAPPAAAGPAPTGGRSMAETLALVRRMKACPFRSRGPGCGCSGANCALRRGAIVPARECLDCVDRYPA